MGIFNWGNPKKQAEPAKPGPYSDFKNEVETLMPDERKKPPWRLTGIVGCFKGKAGRSDYRLRERWENDETGEIELRAITLMENA